MRLVEDSGPSGQMQLMSRSWESGGMGYQEKHEKHSLVAVEGNVVLTKSVAEGRVTEPQVSTPEYQYEIDPNKLIQLIREHGSKRV